MSEAVRTALERYKSGSPGVDLESGSFADRADAQGEGVAAIHIHRRCRIVPGINQLAACSRAEVLALRRERRASTPVRRQATKTAHRSCPGSGYERLKFLGGICRLFRNTRQAFLDHERSKSELKAMMPEDAKEAIGHGVRAKRSKSRAVSFDLLEAEVMSAPKREIFELRLKRKRCSVPRRL
jgi:hypothetical protein